MNEKRRKTMKLDNFKNSPISIIAFIALTFLFSYLIIGNPEIATMTTLLSVWIFMMPRLTHENSIYKDKLPKFLFKGDLINKLLSVLIPLVLWILYAVSMKNATVFENPLFGLLFVIMPIVPAGIQYFVLTHSDSPVDWVSAFATAIFTFFGAEFINAGFGTTVTSMFPFAFNGPIIITQLWSIFLEILLIYSFYRIISVLIPSRTLSATATALTWVFIAMVQKMYIVKLGITFKLSELLNIKQFIATVKMLFLSTNMPAALIIQGLGIVMAITIAMFMLNKWTTIYDMKERLRGSVIGLAVFATCLFAFGFVNNYAKNNDLTLYKSTMFTLVSEYKEKNVLSEENQELIDKEMEEMGWGDNVITEEGTEPTQSESTETTPINPDQMVPPQIQE
jgi:hypothetical protein